ncbi:hypothetical protein ASE00_12515 [Sphingomonas sp. Root710]|uniref:hypothetical protein n=1 Tax=Sphingomonas sp. Root710 TaxID=1736594 RepID=UPI0006FFB09C|nr:hypothetical protein [Sphingomonas sp. Root710]KRB82836.1 hypothetical protein ASE00_12515 [Sphingomonas sp. Root710]
MARAAGEATRLAGVLTDIELNEWDVRLEPARQARMPNPDIRIACINGAVYGWPSERKLFRSGSSQALGCSRVMPGPLDKDNENSLTLSR